MGKRLKGWSTMLKSTRQMTRSRRTRSQTMTVRLSTTSATRPSSGWTLTSLQRLRRSTISRRSWRPSATPISPSFMVQQEDLQVACLTWEAWEELLGEPHLGLEVREELDPPLRRSTKSLLGTIVFSLDSNAFILHLVLNFLNLAQRRKGNKFYFQKKK